MNSPANKSSDHSPVMSSMVSSQILSFPKTVYDTLWQAYRPFLWRIFFVIVLGFLGRVIILSSAQVIGQFIDSHSELTLTHLKMLISKITLLLLVSFTLTFIFRTVFSHLSALAVSRIYDETTYRVSRFPMSFFEKQPVGKITTRFSSDYGNIFRLFGGPLAEFLSIIFDLVAIILIVVLIKPIFLVNILLAAGLYLFILKRNQLSLRQARRDMSANRAPSISHFSQQAEQPVRNTHP